MNRFVKLFIIVIITFSNPFVSNSQNKTITDTLIVEPSTLISLGFEWYIKGDDNRNATVEVEYRNTGTEKWNAFLPFLRIGNEQSGTPEWDYVTENMLAGSIFDLEPGTEYECRLTLKDPDGVDGEARKIVTLKTKEEPLVYQGGEVRHVYPEGWTGEKEEPAYNGLLHAYYGYPRYADWILTTDPVQAGDKIIVHAGTYKADYKNYRDYHGLTFDGTYFLTQDGSPGKPISIVAAGDGEVIFDGNGSGVLFDVTAGDYHLFEGIKIINTEVAIKAGSMNAYGCNGLAVKYCHFEDIGIGIQGQYEGCRNYYIADNTFIGREDTNIVYHSKLENGNRVQRLGSYYAVKVHGQGHTVCYNEVKYFFDGIDICTHAKPETDPQKKASAIDFYNNEFFLCNDNFIEADGGNHNIRILRNKGFNSGQQALSNQPVLGGPVYWIRNVVYNAGDASTFKFWGMYPAGILAYHNTSSSFFTRDDKPGSNVHSLNNLYLPSDDASQPPLGLYTYTSYSSLDYNGYRYNNHPLGYYSPGPDSMYNFNENNSIAKYATLEAFTNATGQEKHGLIVDYDIFVDAKPPLFSEFNKKNKHLGNAYPVYYPEDVNLQLNKNSSVIDAGFVLPGINDNYNGKAPDLGAYEYGKAKPHYGPRINYLSQEEKEQGWILLFDGESHKGWRGFNMDSISNNWQADNKALVADGSGGDIITEKEFEDFELSLEYKISKGGNSGVFYHVKEDQKYDKIWRTGIEMQVMDNANNPMGKDPVKNASSLYGMYPAGKDATRPAGQWNIARIVVKDDNVQYWLNGELVNEYQLWTDQWYADREKCLHNASRKPDWGEFKKGHIALKDEGFGVAYRNIKIRELE